MRITLHKTILPGQRTETRKTRGAAPNRPRLITSNLDNVDMAEAKKFIDMNSGFFGDGKTYKIVKK
jgi:hypothetical protein